MEVYREGFIHPNYSCRAVADGRQPTKPIAGDSVVPLEDAVAQSTPMANHLQKQARVAELLSDRRMIALRECIDGRCSISAATANPR